MSQRKIALEYASRGIKVFPCHSSKRPITKNGFKDATTDENIIKGWWKKNPKALIGSPNDQFTVIDYDVKPKLPALVTTLAEQALDTLYARDIIPEDAMEVVTKSGGRHFYFKLHPDVSRQPFIMPNIDLLGTGGYVILPDNTNYHVVGDDRPWERFDSLPEFDQKGFTELAFEFCEYTRQARDAMRQQKHDQANRRRKNPEKMSKTRNIDMERLPAYKKPIAKAVKRKGEDGVDYETGEMRFEQMADMYVSSNKSKDVKFEVIFDEEDYIIVNQKINTDMVNAMFHNQTVQRRLLELMSLKCPEVGDTNLQRSVIPSHADKHASMGIRWSQDGSHLIIRDFSNHWGDMYNHIDYNVVRLYATCKYNTLIHRMNAPEFVVWFLRMMVEAGMLRLDTKKTFCEDPKTLKGYTPAKGKVADGILLLDAVKGLYNGYDNLTVFADRFSSAWSGVEVKTAQDAKRWLITSGLCHDRGQFDCSGGKREDGFYNTRIYEIAKKSLDKPIKLSDTVSKIITPKKEVEEKMADKMITSKEMVVSTETYEQILAWAEDNDIPNIPERQDMVTCMGAAYGTFPVKFDLGDTVHSPVISRMWMSDRNDGEAQMLVLYFYSEEIDDLYFENVRDFPVASVIGEEALQCIPISYKVEKEYSDEEAQALGRKLSNYTNNVIRFDEARVRHVTEHEYLKHTIDGVPYHEEYGLDDQELSN